MNQRITGHIKLIDPQKTEYDINEIIELADFNFGLEMLRVLPRSKQITNKRTIQARIREALKGKELETSTPRRKLYSKDDVYKFLCGSGHKYFLRKTNSKEDYERKTREAQKEFKEKMNILSSLSPDVMSLEKQKQEVISRIVIDYITKHVIDIDEELIESDILTHNELVYTSMDDLSQTELLALNRLSGDYEEYYNLRIPPKNKK